MGREQEEVEAGPPDLGIEAQRPGTAADEGGPRRGREP